jgi:chromosome segregation ATPase
MNDHARAELKEWLDQALIQRGVARMRPGAGPIIDVDPAPIGATGGGRPKRSRAQYVDSSSEDEQEEIVPARRTRSNATATAATAPGSSSTAVDSDFVQQAIALVTSSQTVERKLANMQKTIDIAKAAQARAEHIVRATDETLKTTVNERDEAEAERADLQETLDRIAERTSGDQKALQKAERRQTLSDDTVNRIRNEREDLRAKLSEANQKTRVANAEIVRLQGELGEKSENDEEVAGLQEELAHEKEMHAATLAELQAELEREKAEHEDRRLKLEKWKATFAALQG